MPTAITYTTTFGPLSGPIPLNLLDTNYSEASAPIKNINNYAVYGVDIGSTDTYVVTLALTLTVTLAVPLMVTFKASSTNTGPCTLNFQGTGAVGIKTCFATDPIAGSIVANGVYQVAYNGSNWILVGGSPTGSDTLFASSTQTTNGAGVETDAFSHTIVGGTLATNLDTIEFYAAGTYSASGDTDKRIKVVFGGTTLFDSGGLTIATKDWTLNGKIMRTGAGTQKSIVQFTTSDNTAGEQQTDYVTATETLANNITLKLTLDATTAASVVGEMYKDRFFPAA